MEEKQKRRYSLFPKTLGGTLDYVIKPYCKQHGFAEHRLLTEWATIVGPECAGWSIPQKLVFPRDRRDGATLHVLAAGGRALELQHMLPVILDRIHTYFGYSAIARVKFTQALTPVFRKEKKAASPPEAKPSEAMLALVAGCEDAELRAALLALGVRIGEQEKRR